MICKSFFNKRNGLQIVIFGVLFVLISSCEFVPDINTPKIISPEEYSKAMLINCSNVNSLTVFSDEIEVNKNLDRQLNELTYQKFWSGERFIRVKNTQTQNTILNFPVSFKVRENYTIAFYSVANKLKHIVSGDSINSLKFNNFSYFKIINAIENNPRINLKISKNSENIFNFNNSNNHISEYFPINYGNYTIKVINPENPSITIEKNFEIKLNTAYNLIISGNLNSNTIEIKLIQIEL